MGVQSRWLRSRTLAAAAGDRDLLINAWGLKDTLDNPEALSQKTPTPLLQQGF